VILGVVPDVTRSLDGIPLARQPDGADRRAEVVLPRVGAGFIALYALAYISTSLLLLAPLLVTLAL
jgi:hypothetical protein